ncbi:MAG: ABC transporter ATP-binding protein [Treponema sp.]|nr:ABC transporter ATP-binding protein [Treponema sp.]
MNTCHIFKCEGIAKNYKNEPVVQDISLALHEGGFISLLGPSGVGKTTLFNVLSGVEKPDAGKVFLNGEDVSGISGKVSYMLQKDLLLEYYTVLDNVILPLLIRREKKKEARKFAAGFFPMFGLEGYEKNYPSELSGGMRQRAALLRTCLAAYAPCGAGKKEMVILLDEPFSALDAITRRKMQLWYADIAQKMKISTLFITHDVEEALALSDTIYILNGKPGCITKKIDVKRPQNGEFAEQKQMILEAIGVAATPTFLHSSEF